MTHRNVFHCCAVGVSALKCTQLSSAKSCRAKRTELTVFQHQGLEILIEIRASDSLERPRGQADRSHLPSMVEYIGTKPTGTGRTSHKFPKPFGVRSTQRKRSITLSWKTGPHLLLRRSFELHAREPAAREGTACNEQPISITIESDIVLTRDAEESIPRSCQ